MGQKRWLRKTRRNVWGTIDRLERDTEGERLVTKVWMTWPNGTYESNPRIDCYKKLKIRKKSLHGFPPAQSKMRSRDWRDQEFLKSDGRENGILAAIGNNYAPPGNLGYGERFGGSRRLAQREFSSRRDSPVMVRLLQEIVRAN